MPEEATFAEILRRHRRVAGLTQEELAERASMSRRGISDLERGARTRPHPETLTLLVTALALTGQERAALLHAARRPSSTQRKTASLAALADREPFPDARLPTFNTALLGREDTIIALVDGLADASSRLVTLLGTAGIGKTRLAVAIAERARPAFPDGVAFVPVAALRNASLVPGTVAGALGVHHTADLPVAAEISRTLQDRRVLLVLDNLEQLLPAIAPWIAELLAACAGLTILATSRSPLRLSLERRIPVSPLALPEPTADAATLVSSAAVTLFAERASAVHPNFTVTPENAGDIAAICRHLDGLPLAIELAAARSSFLSPAALLRRMDQRLPVLTGGMLDASERHQTLRQAIAWSYDLLPVAEQTLFRRLGVFVGGWTVEAAVAVSGAEDVTEVFEHLASLADQNLITPMASDGEPRFTMLETIREFALEQLEASGMAADARELHAAYILTLAEEASPRLNRDEQITWYARLEAEHANVRAAIEWLRECGDFTRILKLGAALWLFWLDRHGSEGFYWLQDALTHASDANPEVRAAALRGAGALARLQNDLELARTLSREEVALRRAIGDEAAIGEALLGLGVVEMHAENHGQAQALFQEAVAHLGDDGSTWYRSISINSLGWLALMRGDVADAQRLSTEALQLSQGADRVLTVEALLNLGEVARATGDTTTALSMFEQALALAREIDYAAYMAECLEALAKTALDIGDLEQAEARLTEWLALDERIVDLLYRLRLRRDLGRLARLREDWTLAATQYTDALALLESLQSYRRLHEASMLDEVAALAAMIGEPARGARLWGAADALRETNGLWWRRSPDLAQTIKSACDAIGKPGFRSAWDAGRALEPDVVQAEIKSVLSAVEITAGPET